MIKITQEFETESEAKRALNEIHKDFELENTLIYLEGV